MRRFTALFIRITFVVLMAPPLHAQAQWHYQADTSRSFSPGCDMLPAYAYFQVKGKYPESSHSLAARADVALASHKTATDAFGYVTFQVLIDCAGKIAAVKLLQTNTRYEPCVFPEGLVDGLYSFLRSLKGWKQAERAGRPVNYSAYISFKIDGGHVVQVSP